MRRRLSGLGASARQVIAIGLLVSTQFCAAADFDYGADVGFGRSDNVLRSNKNAKDEEIAALGVNFALANQGPRLELDLVSDLEYTKYLKNTYKSKITGGIDGVAGFELIPKTLKWVVLDDFGQARLNQFSPPTPENQQNINYVSTGPDVRFEFGESSRLEASGRFSRVTYEKSPFDGNQYRGSLALTRQLARGSEIALSARMTRVEFDDESSNTSYDQGEAFLRYGISGARTRMSLDVGVNSLKGRGPSQAGGVLRFEATRELSRYSRLRVSVGRESSNAGDIFRQLQVRNGIVLTSRPVQVTADPFTHRFINASWGFRRGRSTIDVSTSYSDERYETQRSLDRVLKGVDARVSRNLTATLSASVGLNYIDERYRIGNQDFHELMLHASVSKSLGQSLSIKLDYDRFDRGGISVEGVEVANRRYFENQFWVRLVYLVGEKRTTLNQDSYRDIR